MKSDDLIPINTPFKPFCPQCFRRAEAIYQLPALVSGQTRVLAKCHGKEFIIYGEGHNLNLADLMLKDLPVEWVT